MIMAFRVIVIENTIEENEELEDDLEVFVTEEVAEASLKLLSENLDLSNNSNSLINELRRLGLLEIQFSVRRSSLAIGNQGFSPELPASRLWKSNQKSKGIHEFCTEKYNRQRSV